MNLLGGEATIEKQLGYYSDNFISTTYVNEDTQEITTTIIKNTMNKKQWYYHIPVLRGITIYFIQEFTKGKKFIPDGRIILVPIIYLVDKFFLHIGLMNYFYIGFLLLLLLVARLNNDMTELHGAEHMCATYYNENKTISVAEINEIKKTSRFHKQCGTTLIMKNIILFLILSIFIKDYFIKFFLVTGITYEIFKYQDNKVMKVLLYFDTMISKFIQLNIFTKDPKDIHIKMAIDAINKLENMENKIAS